MKSQDLQDALCGDEDQPWPSEAIYDVEGLHFHELTKLHSMLVKGEGLPSYEDLREVIRERESNGFVLAGPGERSKEASKAYPLLVKAARRKAMAASLGVTDPREQADLAREAGTALDRVAVAAKRVGVDLDLSRRGSRRELLETAALIFAGSHRGDSYAPLAVKMARDLIEAVDRAVAGEGLPTTEGHNAT